MRFLVDGYNLMHVTGYLGSRKRGHLEAARTRFLDWLASETHRRRAGVRVVFDGQNAPGWSPETDYRGVRVRFAYRETADDEIETLLAEATPTEWIVVSNDGRLHESARRAGWLAWRCEAFLDWLVTDRRPPTPPIQEPTPEKPTRLDADQEAELLAAFERPRSRKP